MSENECFPKFKKLRLTHLSNTKLTHGLSGGERRLVSIGQSLLHDPAVLLLDEPTSGLDSTSAFNVKRILKSIDVSRQRTVVLSMHQPSFKILSTMDRIMLLSKGKVVHHGTIYINIGYDKEGIEKRFGLFAFTLTFLLSSTTEALPIFLDERPILSAERNIKWGLQILVLPHSKYPCLLAISACHCDHIFDILLLPSESIASWQAFAYFVLVVWINFLMENSFVFFLSSVAPNYIAGTSLVTILMGCFFLFSGYSISKDNMPK
ncbi:hypothetical protein V6N11_051432 [Hibiscus sabdariffa]|uniref:ABC transporter domain-containing protein n=1 Tax=Hibiscus sabdariffa TaxID=183260 RepID=A0ABR2U723_9ROSI